MSVRYHDVDDDVLRAAVAPLAANSLRYAQEQNSGCGTLYKITASFCQSSNRRSFPIGWRTFSTCIHGLLDYLQTHTSGRCGRVLPTSVGSSKPARCLQQKFKRCLACFDCLERPIITQQTFHFSILSRICRREL